MKKFFISLAPALLVTAFALGIGASLASAAPPCTTNVLCNGSNAKLRDDAVAPPAGGGYGASALAINTKGPLRLSALGTFNENPTGYAFFGIKFVEDPVTSPTVCEKAKGLVTFVDIQDARNNTGAFSPVYDNTERAWPFIVNSDNTGCPVVERGVVTIEHVALFFPNLQAGNLAITGTIRGKYVQPSSDSCPAGGIELNKAQILAINGGNMEVEISNGASKGPAFICFVSSNNNLFPERAPTWSPFRDEAGSPTPGIWKD